MCVCVLVCVCLPTGRGHRQGSRGAVRGHEISDLPQSPEVGGAASFLHLLLDQHIQLLSEGLHTSHKESCTITHRYTRHRYSRTQMHTRKKTTHTMLAYHLNTHTDSYGSSDV